MKIKKCRFGLAAAAVVLGATGCVERDVYVPVSQPAVVGVPEGQPLPPGTVVVQQPPPSPPVEVIPPAPGGPYYWVPGYWSWQGQWVWVPGVWAVRPHPQAVWYNGHWERRHGGYIWIGGRWR